MCRAAASENRRKKREHIKRLENQIAVLESQNKTLTEELRSLKDVSGREAERSLDLAPDSSDSGLHAALC